MMALALSLLMVLMTSSLSEGDVVRATEGDDVTLNCNYTRGALPEYCTVIWRSRGKALSSSNQSLSLQLRNVLTSHSGIYQCYITNVRFQRDIELNVTAKATGVTKPTGGVTAAHPSVCAVAALFFLPLYVL